MWSDLLSTQKTPQLWFLEQSKSCISKSHTAIWSHWPVLVLSPSVACNWSHHCIMGDLIGPRWGDLCSTRSLTRLLLVSSPNHHSSIPFTISCSPFPPFFFFTPPLSSGLAAMLSSAPFQLNEWEITQFIQIRDSETQYFFQQTISWMKKDTRIATGLLWWTHNQDMGLSQSIRNNMEEETDLLKHSETL